MIESGFEAGGLGGDEGGGGSPAGGVEGGCQASEWAESIRACGGMCEGEIRV